MFLQQYSRKEELLKNMMGLLGNVAEVQSLRVHLMQLPYMVVFTDLIRTVRESIEVFYTYILMNIFNIYIFIIFSIYFFVIRYHIMQLVY